MQSSLVWNSNGDQKGLILVLLALFPMCWGDGYTLSHVIVQHLKQESC